LNTRATLKVDEARLYEMIKLLPLRITREQLLGTKWRGEAVVLNQLPEAVDRLRELFRTHDEPAGGYRVLSCSELLNVSVQG